MEIFFQNILNEDLNYYIFKLLHKIQLNEVFNELFQKIRNFNCNGIFRLYKTKCRYTNWRIPPKKKFLQAPPKRYVVSFFNKTFCLII